MHDSDLGTSGAAVSRSNGDLGVDPPEIDAVLTTAADVESAGRSCLAIVALAAIILALLLVWFVVRSIGGG